jgi:hypothetical protein
MIEKTEAGKLFEEILKSDDLDSIIKALKEACENLEKERGLNE